MPKINVLSLSRVYLFFWNNHNVKAFPFNLFTGIVEAFSFWPANSNHVISCDITSCHVTSCHVMPCHVMSCHITSQWHAMPYHTMSCHITSCHAMSHHIISWHVMPWHTMPCYVSYHIMSCHAMPCHIMSFHVTYTATPLLVCGHHKELRGRNEKLVIGGSLFNKCSEKVISNMLLTYDYMESLCQHWTEEVIFPDISSQLSWQ